MIERHADVKRYSGIVFTGGKCVAIISRQDRSLYPVLVGVITVRGHGAVFRLHSQITALSAALRRSFPSLSSVVDAERRLEADVVAAVIDDVMR